MHSMTATPHIICPLQKREGEKTRNTHECVTSPKKKHYKEKIDKTTHPKCAKFPVTKQDLNITESQLQPP